MSKRLVMRIWLLLEVRRVVRDRNSSVVASAVLSKVVFTRPLIQPFAGIGGWIRDDWDCAWRMNDERSHLPANCPRIHQYIHIQF